MSLVTIAACSVILIGLAVALLRVKSFFSSVALLSAYSGFIAVLFAVLGAVDVGFTEAVVGAGVSGVMVMAILDKIPPTDLPRLPRAGRIAALGVVLAIAAVLSYGAAALPAFGDPESPAAVGIAQRYIDGSLAEMATPNVVTSILADYRGFDTLIETTVVVTAAVGCALILRRRG